MKRALSITLMLLVLAMGLTAQAQVGPIDPLTGFPAWVVDTAGVQMALCDQGGGAAGAPPCPSFTLDPLGAIEEAMYYSATAETILDDGTRILVSYFVEAAGAVPPDPALISNGILVRIRVPTAPVADTPFTVTGPWGGGTAVLLAGDTDTGNTILASVDALGPAFTAPDLRTGPVNPFIGNGTGTCIGPLFLGDGVTPAPLAAAGPTGLDAVTVTGGGIAFTTNLFIVEGKMFTAAAAGQVAIERGSISGTGARAIGTVIVSTGAGNAINITAIGGTGLPTPIQLVGDIARGRFFANVPMGAAAANPIPTVTLQVLNNGVPVLGLEALPVPMEDIVTVRSATYSLRTRILAVSAASSMPGTRTAPGATLTIKGTDEAGNDLGFLNQVMTTARSQRILNVAVPPAYVSVESNRGGKTTIPVTIR
jgi:hypothetical protein